MNAITTKYLGPTEIRGSRIKASIETGLGVQSVTVGYPHEKSSGAEAHSVAALALAKKMGIPGDLLAAATPTGYVFVFEQYQQRFQSTTTAEDVEAARERTNARLDAILSS